MQQGEPQPNFELPAPIQSEQAADVDTGGRPASPERSHAPSLSPQQAQPAPSVTAIPFSDPVNPIQQQPVLSSNPVVADDNDLIEKEWVIKAKQIVAATHHDPHTQSKELSKFKADYLKKRYNKDLKVEES